MLLAVSPVPWRRVAPAMVAMALIAALVVFWIRFLKAPPPFDAAYILTAGKMWLAGVDPYGPMFASYGAQYFPPNAAIWAYPPQWWPVATSLALFGDQTAFLVWKFANIVLLLAAGALLYRTAQGIGARTPLWSAALFAVVLLTADTTKATFNLGQTSILIAFGFALLMRGLQVRSWALQAIGLTILLLKPQFGLHFLILAAVFPATRTAAAAAVAATTALCLPLLVVFGFDGVLDSAQALLRNIAHYGTIKWNRPLEVSGLAYVAALAGLPRLSPILCVVLASGVSLVLLVRAGARADVNGPDPRLFWLVSLASFFAIVPLHAYDLILASTFLLFLPCFRLWAGACVAAAIALYWREDALSYGLFMDPSTPPGAVLFATMVQAGIVTTAGMLLLVAVSTGLRSGIRTSTAIRAPAMRYN